MPANRLFVLAFALIFSPISHATAILKTSVGEISAVMGSEYPTLPGSPTTSDTASYDMANSGFVDEFHMSTPDPNYGWAEWKLAEEGMTFYAGQAMGPYYDYSYQGYGFSMLDFQWAFTVQGDGGVLHQTLLSGTGAIQTILLDISDPMAFVDLSATNRFSVDTGSLNLIDGHSYLLGANLANRANSDGWEVEYFINLENAMIEVTEPGLPLLLLSGLIMLGWVGKQRQRVNSP